jgi:Tfp pilus assembly protein PilN
MSRININLNPQKDSASQDLARNISGYTPLLALGVAVVFVMLILLQALILRKQHSYNVYKAKWAQWQDEDAFLKRIKSNIAGLEEEKAAIAAITTADNQAAKLFADVYRALPKNIWFDEFKFDGKLLNLHGYIVRWEEDDLASLDKFINRLRGAEYFSRLFKTVNIKQSQKANIRGVEVLRFSLECKK